MRPVTGKPQRDRAARHEQAHEDVCPAERAGEGEEQLPRARVEAGGSDAEEGPEDEDTEEARLATRARDAVAPTRAEYERHMLTHMPNLGWYRWCITGRGRALQHRRTREEGRDHVPIVAMYSCYVTESSTPVHCHKCSQTGVVVSQVLHSKEATPELLRLVVEDIENMGHTRVVIRGDNEPAMKAFVFRIHGTTTHPMVVEESPDYETQANGLAERCAQTIKGMVLTGRSALEGRISVRTPDEHPVLTWLIRHAACLHTRYHVGPDGRTHCERVAGCRSGAAVTE